MAEARRYPQLAGLGLEDVRIGESASRPPRDHDWLAPRLSVVLGEGQREFLSVPAGWNVAQLPEFAEVVARLGARLDAFFDEYANPRWDLWKGGTVKSNSTRPFLWKEIWGDSWTPEY